MSIVHAGAESASKRVAGRAGAPAAIVDQAARLRALMAGRRAEPEPARLEPHVSEPARTPRRRWAPIITITSGKGGVGKTSTTVNLAIALAECGLRVTLLDADLGMANADVMCGLSPSRRLDLALPASPGRAGVPLRDLEIEAPGGFRLVPGAIGVPRMADLSAEQRDALVERLSELERGSDLVLVDTGAGLSPGVTWLGAAADHVLVLATPDPASITDAYAMIKCLVPMRAQRAESNLHESGKRSAARAGAPDAVDASCAAIGGSERLALVMNQVAGPREAIAVSERIGSVCRRFLGMAPNLVGYVRHDVRAIRAVRARVPLLLASPRSRAARDIRRLAATMRAAVGI